MKKRERNEEYVKKLRDPRWQKIRLRILERDAWTCKWCGDKDSTLHIHHVKYHRDKDPWESPPDELLTLCETCHEEETQGRYDEEQALLDALRVRGFSSAGVNCLACDFFGADYLVKPNELADVIGWLIIRPERQRRLIELYNETRREKGVYELELPPEHTE